MIFTYKIVEKTKVLGLGERFAIWFQGCNQRCKNCIVPDSWDTKKGGIYIPITEIIKQIKNSQVTGVTISGGEPFLQNQQLLKLVKEIKNLNLNIMVYSGYKYEELLKDEINKAIFDNIDLLIDSEYIDELNQNTPLIGSSNQGLYIFSQEGYKLAFYISQKEQREIEFLINNGEVFMVGIPPKDLEKKLKG